ncbi:hypothetical protein [Haloarchaeobius sp. HME9146]|uniref:hypothetical protein n=1 Tax=Haloarchaeobius sp. HME9146 TaxID=2978732 RepID=UPI0021BEBFAF|nr:hypothetical protein [Haloarchaeobius sp. HME9146]MCT9095912.1 hypothetical protein [Haloarchaeobius sp. HME9146]
MKSDSISSTRDGFAQELETLIREFEATGLDLEGGYTLRDDDERNLEVQIVQIANQPDGE